MIFYRPKLLTLFSSLTVFPFSSLSIGWYCVAGVFALIGWKTFSSCLALPTFLNINNKIHNHILYFSGFATDFDTVV